MEQFFEGCGLVATFIGTLLEGEVLLVTAMVSAKLGSFSAVGALIAGFLGSYAQGWFKYYIAKKHGRKLLTKSKKLNKKVEKSSSWFDKSPIMYLTLYKFMFGLTTVILVMAGLRDMSYMKFTIYSAISSLVWVAVVGALGYYCADTVLSAFDSFSMHKYEIIGILVVIGLIVWYFRERRCLQDCVEVAVGE